ncbi:MAG: chemotaxis protein CheW [Spirochaetales bacterium]|nr:chemotaxis protein CheW [Spirochaetales bacterium]
MSTKVETKTSTYLTFRIGTEDFAVDVLKVKEILEIIKITNVPKTPDFMKGVINLRGSVVPVVDMHIKFGLAAEEQTVDTCIIVMEVSIGDEIVVIGAIADMVKEVINIDAENIKPSPKIGTAVDMEFIDGIGKVGEEFVIILDINKVFSVEDIKLVKSIGRERVEG